MSEVRYATFPLDCRALKAANDKVWQDHPELAGRKLTMARGEPETSYRKEWMDAYIKDGGKWQKTRPKLRPGDPLTTCQPAAATPAPAPPPEQPLKAPKPQDSPRPTPAQRYEKTRGRNQKNLDMTRQNLDYWEKLIPRLKSAGGVAEALERRNANRRWAAEDEKEKQLFEDDKNRHGPKEALRRADLRRNPASEEDKRLREATKQSEVLTDISKAAQEARQREAEAKSPEEKKKWAEAAEALEADVNTMKGDILKFLQQKK